MMNVRMARPRDSSVTGRVRCPDTATDHIYGWRKTTNTPFYGARSLVFLP